LSTYVFEMLSVAACLDDDDDDDDGAAGQVLPH
jgi:hypothetical protein